MSTWHVGLICFLVWLVGSPAALWVWFMVQERHDRLPREQAAVLREAARTVRRARRRNRRSGSL